MSTPRSDSNPERNKELALQHLGSRAKKRRAAETAERNAMLFAREAGASWRELAAAVGDRDHMTVKRIVLREQAAGGDDEGE